MLTIISIFSYTGSPLIKSGLLGTARLTTQRKNMSIIGWIVLGIIAGALAKLIMPGKQGGGILVTMVLGIVGAMLGGWLGSFIPGLSDGIQSFSLGTLFTAIVGSLIILFIYGKVTANK